MSGDTPQGLDVPALLAQLTLEEKAELLDGSDFWHTTPVPRLGIPALLLADGPHGLRRQAEGGDHLGLTGSVPATCFPPAAGLASSWDVDLLARVGEALGRECRDQGVSVLLGPGVNMKRSPLCGRNFEYLSEDPLLAGHLAAALVAGVQRQGVGTSLKHFAANNQETDRMTVSADVDERTLREIYLPAFERVVTAAQPWTVMCSYNRINGVYASEDPWLLTDVLRGDWGFTGLVVSDWTAVDRRDVGLAAGLDLEMPSSDGGGTTSVLEGLRAGRITEDDVDRGATRVLALVDRALRGQAVAVAPVDVDAHHALAREAAAASAVLLTNDGVLPLAAEGGAVAVIGEFARTPRFQGAGSSQVEPTRLDTALDALREGLAGRREVLFAPGYEVEAAEADPGLVAEAVAAAAAAEVVALFLGLPPSWESEGYDRDTIDLPATQVALLHAVADANPQVVVVLSNGSVVDVSPWQDRAAAVLEGWLLGQAGGAATADLLLGVVSPSGRLAETVPARFADNPTIGAFPGEHGHVRYGEGLLIGYRWYDAHQLPVAHPFGHGLSYTTFDWSDLEVTVRPGDDVRVDVRLTVTNSGDRAATETVQLYVTDPQASVYRPEQELRAFTRVHLEPGSSTAVELTLDRRAFAYWHVGLGRWVVEGGTFGLRLGASSRDLRLAADVELPGDDLTPPLAADSTAEAWLAHPDAGPWLRGQLADAEFGRLLADPRNGQMLRAVPLVRLSRMPGFPLREQEVSPAVGRFGAGRDAD
ncbi:glycoside hydrolase family 3 C-terminal domain-containing protein [Modestobacter sp. L9-4]|uniref:glycoside hydrolase family 3 C-terminal domain-containing protein n=1 Tax=Modestobacter sp. L9-4 TaxID=2851567 RepID=UPI001C798143|nr:glycoside hydrolase family 3 C-terminal domain-containing protein [Modestobacter sp. L9-4]QXG76269.1 glycoside hydrolase family 3 C-terminal domain-containing protein [Modestobacter sp. L9-4]